MVLEVLRSMASADAAVQGLIEQLRSYSDQVPSSWWPDDEQWREHLLTSPHYRRLTRPRMRMLLEVAEARLVTPKTERVRFEEKLTIEHVIPQSWEHTWPLSDGAGAEAEARRRAVIDRLGNLTLANRKLNPALSNDPWASKRIELEKHSRLRLNADLVRKNPEAFDEDVVDARGRELADLLAQEWPGPKSF